MAVYKDKQRGTWYVLVYYTNWKGESDRKMKRGFKTRKEAVAWENTFLNKNTGDLNMTFTDLSRIYITFGRTEIITLTIRQKKADDIKKAPHCGAFLHLNHRRFCSKAKTFLQTNCKHFR